MIINNNSRLILLALRFSRPSLNFLKSRWRPKGRVSLSIYTPYYFLFFIVSWNGSGITDSVGSWGVPNNGGNSESEVRWVAANRKNYGDLPFPYPNRHCTLGCCQPQTQHSGHRADFNAKSMGKKRQKYNITKKTRLQDQVDYSSTIFVGAPMTVDGEEYVTLISGGRIPSRLAVV